MEKIVRVRARTEAGRKEGEVIGKIFLPKEMAGKVVFFQGTVPEKGIPVNLIKYQDKGRVITCSEWVKLTGVSDEEYKKLLQQRIDGAKDKTMWMHFVRMVIDSRPAPNAVGFLVELPLVTLEKVLKEKNSSLTGKIEELEDALARNTDLVSRLLLDLFKDAKGVFKSNGGDDEIMKLPSFLKFFDLISEMKKHPGQWPELWFEGEMTKEGYRWAAKIG